MDWKKIGLAAATAAAGWFAAPSAAACGGCFVPPEDVTQVTGHRMVLSVSQQQTTLYDQFEYSGDPSEFSWVLPIKGQVEIGLSSDLLFEVLENATAPQVFPPNRNCAPCSGPGVTFVSATSGASGGGGVEVIASEVVGPYETVQLSATDPQALNDWLAGHGYNVPADVQPIVDEYVSGGFNFLALRLIPGAGVDKMQPVRVTTPGGSPALPLKMVAAGTGATTTMTLWVVAEGRYEPTNFPSFRIQEKDLVWNWDTSSSNYRALRDQGYADSDGFAWQIESFDEHPTWQITDPISQALQFLPEAQHGYYATMDQTSQELAQEDIDTLFAGLPTTGGVRITRLRAELSRPALAKDLALGASADQSVVPRIFRISSDQTVGTPPPCPCGGSGGSSATGGLGSGGCAMEGTAGRGAAGSLALAFIGLGLGLRRRRQPRS